jgi:hypothetical protein
VIRRISFLLGAAAAGLVGCTTVTEQGTLAELDAVQPDVDEVYLEDGLERAAESYRRYLEETPETARTPEAMRRLADLQIEQAYGVIGTGEVVELAASAGVRAGIRAARIAAPGFAEPGAAGRRYPHGRGR